MTAAPPASKELNDTDLRRALLAAMEAHPGVTLEDMLYATGMPETRPAKERVKRLLGGLVEAKETERWLDHNEAPPAWRYRLFGNRPPKPDARRPLDPSEPVKTAKPVQEIVKDIPPARPAAAAAPAKPGQGEHPDDDEPDAPSVMQQVKDYVDAHPGVGFSDVERDVGEGAGQRLAMLARSGRIAKRGERPNTRYFPLGPKDAERPARREKPAPRRAAKEPRAGKPGPKPRVKGEEPPNVRKRLRQMLKDAGKKGVGSHTIGDELGHNGLSIAGQLLRLGEARREGSGRGSRYYFVRDPLPNQEHKRHGPRAPTRDDALQRAVDRVRAARAELAAAIEDLQREAGAMAGGGP